MEEYGIQCQLWIEIDLNLAGVLQSQCFSKEVNALFPVNRDNFTTSRRRAENRFATGLTEVYLVASIYKV
ncbi:hypothetical protein GCM10011338_05510 [Alteromonas lipolytica]|uniref:Uncharacterized protein n=1 Tax=Alteromonas lipolytica TaxID=1856405 RepID=A0A1E8FGK1_9ALTE|nr:hypothetical protein BFC17_15910 [Alteromonas lipolytica]GGF56102.1 hypothetical protein GCM10011338_05510 [Alteromonas lipolytica]